MDQFHDDAEEYYETSRRKEELEKSLFAMKDMLRQLNEAQDDASPSANHLRGPHGHNRGPQGNKRGRGRGRGIRPMGRSRINNPIVDFGRESPMQKCFQNPFEDLGGQWLPEQGYQDYYTDPNKGWNSRGGFSPGRGHRDKRGSQGERYPGPLSGFTPHGMHRYHPEQGDAHEDSIKQQMTRHNPSRGVRPQFLAEVLANYQNFSCSLLKLLEQRNIPPPAVRDVAYRFPHIFTLIAEEIALRPKIRLCQGHNNHEGCQNQESCEELHICARYVMDVCYEKSCVFGHRWRTGHNDPVLSTFFLERLPFPTLQQLLQLQGATPASTGTLDVCSSYNGKEGCNHKNCSSLHICRTFVTGLTSCKISMCPLSHDLLSPGCKQLLEQHGIATNEAPRDILVALLNKNPSLRNKEQSSSKAQNKDFLGSGSDEDNAPIRNIAKDEKTKHSSEQFKVKENTKLKNTNRKERDSSDLENESSLNKSDNDSETDEKKTRTGGSKTNKQRTAVESVKSPMESKSKMNPVRIKPEIRKTFWSHYLQGDVPVPEICYHSVESSCPNEGTGCQRLHATKHFHWQVKDQNSRWLNLRSDQVACLEYAFCDPENSNAELPRLDPATLEYSVSGLFILMGRESWQADFNSMIISNNNKTKTLNIRRLTTGNTDGQKVKPASYIWYFVDKNNKWVKYGDVDTAGASHLVSSITSDDIEKQYLQDPKSSMPFINSKFSYLLDFKSMTQMNIVTRATRKIIRRPYPHLQDQEREEKRKKGSVDLPDSWEKMQPEVRVSLVTLAPSSSEYTTIISLIRGRISTSKVLKVQRVQNPYLWRAFQNKVKEMMAVYKDESKVNVRQLFHGTPHDVVHNICSENFDWRLHGTKSGQNFGRGSYFAVNADYSYNYTSPDSCNLRYMFIARVAVGTVTRGNSQMVRPPTNPQTLVLFDSTVDSVSNPSIIVKYDKQEYYPEYLLTLS